MSSHSLSTNSGSAANLSGGQDAILGDDISCCFRFDRFCLFGFLGKDPQYDRYFERLSGVGRFGSFCFLDFALGRRGWKTELR